MNVQADPSPALVVPVDEVARRMGLQRPLDADTTWLVEQAVLDAQGVVEAYLGRPITPQTRVVGGVWAKWDGTWAFTPDDILIAITDVKVETWDGTPTGGATGTYQITYLCGLDAANDPQLRPIRSYVLAHARNSPDLVAYWRQTTNPQGVVSSVSAGDQSVSFTPATQGGGTYQPGTGLPGALPSLESLVQWQRLGAYHRDEPVYGAGLYEGGLTWWGAV